MLSRTRDNENIERTQPYILRTQYAQSLWFARLTTMYMGNGCVKLQSV